MQIKTNRPPSWKCVIGVWMDHLKVARIPLLMLGLGAALTFWVDQIQELFFLLANSAPLHQKIVAVVATGLFGAVVWLATRTAFLFDLPSLLGLSDPRGEAIRTWAPRVLGALVPLLMLAGYVAALLQPSIRKSTGSASYTMLIVFFIEAAVLFTLGVKRRAIQRRFGSTVAQHPTADLRLTRWSQLRGPAYKAYTVLFVGNLVALGITVIAPGLLSGLGPIPVILLAASFGTAVGTYLTVHAYRLPFPFLTLLFALAVICQWSGVNDNHRVRLYPAMTSDMTPDWDRQVDSGAPLAASFESYAKGWIEARPAESPIYVVSAEGGGIRAAAWAALVLTELDLSSAGKFGKSLLAASGVSGGSLGLSLYDAMLLKAQASGGFNRDASNSLLTNFLETDFLAPVIESMFLPDATQRFLPGRWFIDRGQRLEQGWEKSWGKLDGCPAAADGSPPPAIYCDVFRKPWGTLWSQTTPTSSAPPILFMNSTDVGTGQRFVQYPFASLSADASQDDLEAYHNGKDAPRDVAKSAPLSAVVHNSARFTYVSPAGTLLAQPNSGQRRRQLVDGGYFENSGATTLADVVSVIAKSLADHSCDPDHGGLASPGCRIRIIHISNDANVSPLLASDSCTVDAKRDTSYGELLAPPVALANTRDARGAYARISLRNAIAPTGDEGPQQRFFHFRLCTGTHPLPLGWTLSGESMLEMRHQLCNQLDPSDKKPISSPNAAFNRVQVSRITETGAETPVQNSLCTFPP